MNSGKYPLLAEGYGSAFSIYGAMKNLGRHPLVGDDCWCEKAVEANYSYFCDNLARVNPFPMAGGGCYNQFCCQSCDVNKTGNCSQASGRDNLAGVS